MQDPDSLVSLLSGRTEVMDSSKESRVLAS